jgi:putative sporulation protein YtaF
LLGARLYQYISATTAGVVGGLVILASGLWVWFEEPLLRRVASPSPVVSEPHAEWRQVVDVVVDPGAADLDHSGVIEAREALLLAAGLTLNNLPNGVAAGVLGLPAVPMTGAVCLASLCSIGLGVAIGRHGMRWAGRAARPVAALMLMLLGVYEICVSG